MNGMARISAHSLHHVMTTQSLIGRTELPSFFTASALLSAPETGNPFAGAKSGARAAGDLEAVAELRRQAIAEPASHLWPYFAQLLALAADDVQVAAPALGTSAHPTHALLAETILVAFNLAALHERAGDPWSRVVTSLVLLERATTRAAFTGPLLDERAKTGGVVGGWPAIAASVRLVTLLSGGCTLAAAWNTAREIEELGAGPLCNPAPCALAANLLRRAAVRAELAMPMATRTAKRQFWLLAAAEDRAALTDYVYSVENADLDALYAAGGTTPERARVELAAATAADAPPLPALAPDETLLRQVHAQPQPAPPRPARKPQPSSTSAAARFLSQ
jgi:hypothetical protein